jgi:hypothetical protein
MLLQLKLMDNFMIGFLFWFIVIHKLDNHWYVVSIEIDG